MHWPEKTHCGHGFHLQCLLQHLDVSYTCPLCRAPNPLRTNILETVMSPRKIGELERRIALDQFFFFWAALEKVDFQKYWEAQELSRHQDRKLKE
ncbi:hypothetical protein TNCV_2625941 [Trichonephila clavipes]|uniref:RING-type domain-containing protein n=1 Tax=Trichonephila clavipes TaxID=2585209 RepID=A0A8X6W6W8_TRICX|nr:hypothetical protein TNCV_2625941 [Trichonephila clavipes]